jgi:hypothetical protein
MVSFPRNIRLTSRDFRKLLEHGAGMQIEKQQKKQIVHLTDTDIFNAYKLGKVTYY